MNKLPDLTISETASELRIRREHVIGLLKSGALAGYDVTPPGAKRTAYRITRQALDDFKAGRPAREFKQSKRRAKQAQPADYVEYFR